MPCGKYASYYIHLTVKSQVETMCHVSQLQKKGAGAKRSTGLLLPVKENKKPVLLRRNLTINALNGQLMKNALTVHTTQRSVHSLVAVLCTLFIIHTPSQKSQVKRQEKLAQCITHAYTCRHRTEGEK